MSGKGDGRLRGKVGAEDPTHRHKKDSKDHQCTHLSDIGNISTCDTVVDDHGHKFREHDLSRHLGEHHQRTDHEGTEIRGDVFFVSFQFCRFLSGQICIRWILPVLFITRLPSGIFSLQYRSRSYGPSP